MQEIHCLVTSHTPLTRDLACNSGMCPDWESNRRPIGSQAFTQSIEPLQPGPASLLWQPCSPCTPRAPPQVQAQPPPSCYILVMSSQSPRFKPLISLDSPLLGFSVSAKGRTAQICPHCHCPVLITYSWRSRSPNWSNRPRASLGPQPTFLKRSP